MLTFRINVRPDEDPEDAAYKSVLRTAHVRQVHLARPIELSLTRVTPIVQQVADIMGLADDLHEVYQVDAKTNPCPGDHSPGA
jgi:hypothetical protein